MGRLPRQTKRRALIARFRALGFDGPYLPLKGSGAGDHPEFMVKGDRVVKLPNPHRGDIGEVLLKLLLKQAGVTVKQWLGEPETESAADAPSPDTNRRGQIPPGGPAPCNGG